LLDALSESEDGASVTSKAPCAQPTSDGGFSHARQRGFFAPFWPGSVIAEKEPAAAMPRAKVSGRLYSVFKYPAFPLNK